MDPFEDFCQKHGIRTEELEPATRKVPQTPEELLREFARRNDLTIDHLKEGLKHARQEGDPYARR